MGIRVMHTCTFLEQAVLHVRLRARPFRDITTSGLTVNQTINDTLGAFRGRPCDWFRPTGRKHVVSN
ncbi:hypothetical protein NEUTE1DRAFT_117820 [Neurospora tetrasperma FGSC 2508]|uniref:Uncharacterized protein n=1 Tax=Neurospora tetrasperma (strain FGSC 2508 / ATCC MYA-4615 / P0657) TaxID=510951 RepID=F8MU66_NEUT8|nr:uncharacterized protein NEUTE1DRAFT_117820 [Neurospora tetrasperma FGSC 2508]EGO55548.1 hypothetical protein NEUTE1DRAFT_117820 [Neurospora tetrasperma FGSC 2508]EGZ69209.1 hypothetical protein NEUTE2DRAFT_145472 [Neurospora tetrasperma FGSC 2509]